MENTESQTQKILNWMLSGKGITSLEAVQKFGCLRLASRILECKKKHKITKRWVVTKTKKRVIEYSIAI